MKISRILSTSVLVGAVFFAGTACSAPSKAQPEAQPEASASSAAKPSAKPVKSQTPEDKVEAAAAAVVLNGYYKYVTDPASVDAIRAAGASFKGQGDAASPEELQKLVEALPDGFKYFDVSSPELIKASYAQLRKNATVLSKRKMEITVPDTAVMVDGDTATIQSNAIQATMNGQKSPAPSIPGVTNLKKNAPGVWVISAV